MQFTFLDMAGQTLFVRDDAEQATWTQEEMTIELEFPRIDSKVISIGQRVFFKDPATGSHQIYEVRQAQTLEPDHYQVVTAEHICIAELSDEHKDAIEITGEPPQTALSKVLANTLWAVGNVDVGNVPQQERLRAEINAFGLNGNVDLTSRPIIYPDKMKAAGYTDFDGDYATLYSTTYDQAIKSGDIYTLLMTPIQQDGYVLSYDQLDEYVDGLCESSNTIEEFKANDTRGLLMHYLPGVQIAEMDAIAEEAHDLSDEWEQLNFGVLSSADLSRGSVWQMVLEIKDSWNIYIEPRVILNSNGTITRYLDIMHTDGTWKGLRLSVDKNMLDPTVTFDDSEVVTALYGYGGSVTNSKGEDQQEVNFADIVWKAEDGHPAKPKGQKYLEYPAATAQYGRNGRPRYGYYQNNDITDPEVLLQKTWESLQESSKPLISIEGTVEDLYRLGYADQPLKLHDIALVEINPAGYKSQIQIIRMTVDLLDPSATTLTIGSYIQNIIYIQRKTDENATGSRGGGGGNSNKDDTTWREFRTTIEAYQDGTGMQIRSVQNDNKRQDKEIAVQEGKITVAYNKITQEVIDRRNADGVLSSTITQTAREIRQEVNNEITGVNSRITQTASQIRSEVNNEIDGVNSYISQTATAIRQEVASDVTELQSSITVQANRISLVVEGTGANAHIKPASIVSAINNGSSSIKISADHITLDGHTVATSLYGEDVQIGVLNCGDAYTSDLAADGDITSTGKIVATEAIGLGNYDASWKSKEVVTSVAVTYGSISGVTVAKEVTSVKNTIYYLGR